MNSPIVTPGGGRWKPPPPSQPSSNGRKKKVRRRNQKMDALEQLADSKSLLNRALDAVRNEERGPLRKDEEELLAACGGVIGGREEPIENVPQKDRDMLIFLESPLALPAKPQNKPRFWPYSSQDGSGNDDMRPATTAPRLGALQKLTPRALAQMKQRTKRERAHEERLRRQQLLIEQHGLDLWKSIQSHIVSGERNNLRPSASSPIVTPVKKQPIVTPVKRHPLDAGTLPLVELRESPQTAPRPSSPYKADLWRDSPDFREPSRQKKRRTSKHRRREIRAKTATSASNQGIIDRATIAALAHKVRALEIELHESKERKRKAAKRRKKNRRIARRKRKIRNRMIKEKRFVRLAPFKQAATSASAAVAAALAASAAAESFDTATERVADMMGEHGLEDGMAQACTSELLAASERAMETIDAASAAVSVTAMLATDAEASSVFQPGYKIEKYYDVATLDAGALAASTSISL